MLCSCDVFYLVTQINFCVGDNIYHSRQFFLSHMGDIKHTYKSEYNITLIPLHTHPCGVHFHIHTITYKFYSTHNSHKEHKLDDRTT